MDPGGRKRPHGPEENDDGASLGLGYSKPEFKKSFSAGEQGSSGSSSSLNFIKFTKADTNLDGSTAAKTRVDKKYESDTLQPTDISKLEVRGEIDSDTLGEAAQYLERFHINLKKTMNTLAGQRQTVQQNFCNCAQVSYKTQLRFE